MGDLRFMLLSLILMFIGISQVYSTQITHDGRAILVDGERKLILSGSIHYPRSTAEMWPDLVRKAKEGGLDTIETYVFWNAHERLRRQYDFSGNLDLIRFLKTIQQEGLNAVLRIGPYVCAEWNYGGFPVWLHNLPGIELRTNNTIYMTEMQIFTTLIVDMVKKEKLFASQGGPVILAQIENEYGNIMDKYGDAGKAYINWCANMADSLEIGVPWIMCQQSDAPKPMINTCNGFYCDNFTPNNPNSPKMWTENWTGWFKKWGGRDPHRTAEDLAYAVARFFQRGGTFQNYYMYHGGTNFGRTAGGPYITTSYDYDAPLDEYGNLNQPKWGHLKTLHQVLKSMEKTLTHGDVNTSDYGNSVQATVYRTGETSSCFLSNSNETSDATIDFHGTKHIVPAWSVSILPDCKVEVYNTAKVNTETWVMAKSESESVQNKLEWVWRPENIKDNAIYGKGHISANKIVDQKADNDVSDYLWYMTSAYLQKDDPVLTNDMTIRINGSSNVLHVYVNGKFVGIQWAKNGATFNHVFEKEVKFHPGKNQVSILSATVGLPNYGYQFDLAKQGITGSVDIVGRKNGETIVKDLSSNKWRYKVNLNGMENKLYKKTSYMWLPQQQIPLNRTMTWYKTLFKAPNGNDAVVVDLNGLGKGEAWVNGKSIGRYWPTYLADENGCSSNQTCDYRGKYTDNKCNTNCGQPSQRWYHVPRSFMTKHVNELVLFEELGGNPSFVKFQTVRVGTTCGSAYENRTMELSCQGRPISRIRFASFGNPSGTCGSFKQGTCQSKTNAISVIQKECVGKKKCNVVASEENFGPVGCGSQTRLLVEAVC